MKASKGLEYVILHIVNAGIKQGILLMVVLIKEM